MARVVAGGVPSWCPIIIMNPPTTLELPLWSGWSHVLVKQVTVLGAVCESGR